RELNTRPKRTFKISGAIYQPAANSTSSLRSRASAHLRTFGSFRKFLADERIVGCRANAPEGKKNERPPNPSGAVVFLPRVPVHCLGVYFAKVFVHAHELEHRP